MPGVSRITDRGRIYEGIELWNEHVPRFTIPDRFVEQNVFAPFEGIEVRGYEVREHDEQAAFGLVKRLQRPVDGYDRTQRAWLSLFAFDPGSDEGLSAGESLLESVTADLRREGLTELVFGQSPQNFLAGAPDALPDAYVEVLEALGFEYGSNVFDLKRDITGYEVPAEIQSVSQEWPNLDIISATNRESLLSSFLEEQFPGRWHYEATNICRKPGGPADFFILMDESSPVGFVRVNRQDGAYLGSNVNWGRQLTGPHCGIGPLGIHEEYRGRGWGLYMIASVTERLANEGYEQCVIDWTDLLEYYRKLGFERWIRYREATLDLSK